MSKLIYYKTNDNRMPLFQTKLKIIEEMGKRYVVKAALTPIAAEHIRQTYKNSQSLSALSDHFDLNYEMKDDQLYCDFVEGTALSQKFVRFLDYFDESEFHQLMKWFQNAVYTLLPDAPFQKSDQIKHIFGTNEEMEGVSYCALANLDFNFDNIILTEDSYKVIDTEWVFELTLPKDYIIYRSFLYLFTKYKSKLSRYCRFEDILDFLSITAEQGNIYYQMEQNFQTYVYGEQRHKNIFYEWCQHNRDSAVKIFHSQIYYSDNIEFNENHFLDQICVLDRKTMHIEFDVNLEEVKSLRIDPVDFPACIRLKKIGIKTQSGMYYPSLTSLDHNAIIVQNEFYLFPHYDAQFRIEFDKKTVVKKVEIEFEIENCSDEHHGSIALQMYQKDRETLQNDLIETRSSRDELRHLLFLANASLDHYRHPVRTVCRKLKRRIIRR